MAVRIVALREFDASSESDGESLLAGRETRLMPASAARSEPVGKNGRPLTDLLNSSEHWVR